MGKNIVYFIEICMKGDPLSALKGNNSCKRHNFRIKVCNVKWSIANNIDLILHIVQNEIWSNCRKKINITKYLHAEINCQ
jgi:hypothetical protein